MWDLEAVEEEAHQSGGFAVWEPEGMKIVEEDNAARVRAPYLGYISAASRLYLGCISATSRPYLGHISALSRLYLGSTSKSA